MKKFISGLLIGLLLSLPIATFASGQALKLIVNGQDITADAQPVVINGRTLVPARALAEKLGATVAWDGASQTVVVTSAKEQTPALMTTSREEQSSYINECSIGEEFKIGLTTYKCTGISYSTDSLYGNLPTGEHFVLVSFDVETDDELHDFYTSPSMFVRSMKVDGKEIIRSFYSSGDDKIYKGIKKSVKVATNIPIGKKVEAIGFRNWYSIEYTTFVKVD